LTERTCFSELERRVVTLVTSILSAHADEETPEWLMRPGRAECGDLWPLLTDTYRCLTDKALPDLMPRKERRQIDAVIVVPGRPPFILEVDETQHFNKYRAQTLDSYPPDVRVAFPVNAWRQRSRMKERLEGGRFGAPKPPLFPGEKAGTSNGHSGTCSATLCHRATATARRFGSGTSEVEDWIHGPQAADRMRELLSERIAPR
jgi:hypothetical protein